MAVDSSSASIWPSPPDSQLARHIEVRRSPRRARTVSARLHRGVLVVSVPDGLSPDDEQTWAYRMLERVEKKVLRQRLNSTGELERRAHELNRAHFTSALEWKSITYVTNQSLRLGSCSSSEGTIRISAELARLPAWVQDYVIVHELAHLVEPSHSEDFWNLVRRYPLAERARAYLEGFSDGRNFAR